MPPVLAAALPSIFAIAATGVQAGATMYSANKEATSARKATEAQKQVGLAQIEAAGKAETQAAETAKAKLKLKQATKSNTILTSPLGVSDQANTNTKTLLGV